MNCLQRSLFRMYIRQSQITKKDQSYEKMFQYKMVLILNGRLVSQEELGGLCDQLEVWFFSHFWIGGEVQVESVGTTCPDEVLPRQGVRGRENVHRGARADRRMFFDGVSLHLTPRVDVQGEKTKQLAAVFATDEVRNLCAIKHYQFEKGICVGIEVGLELGLAATDLFGQFFLVAFVDYPLFVPAG